MEPVCTWHRPLQVSRWPPMPVILIFQNWINAAMALHHLEGLDDRLKAVIKKSTELFEQLNKLPGIKISALPAGSNIFDLQVAGNVDLAKLRESLNKQYRIFMGGRRGNGPIKITVNESLLTRDNASVVEAFKASLANATV